MIDFEKIFNSVNQNPMLKKYLLIGGFIHLFWYVLMVLTMMELNIPKSYFIALNILCCLIELFLFGFFIDTVRKNIQSDDAAKFEFSDFNILKRFGDGFVFSLLFILPLVVSFLFFGVILGLVCALLIYYRPHYDGDLFPGICVIVAIILAFVLCILVVIFLYPQILENYLNKNKILAICDFKVFFNMFRKNFGASLVVSLMSIIFSMLWCIPFVGFYFDMVWANMFAQYARIVKD